MTARDLIGLGISFAYPVLLLGLAEGIRRWSGYPQDFTRKLIHIGAGMWVFAVLWLFDTWYIGLIPFATFILLNYIFYRYRLLKAMDTSESTPGTVYFALSITLLFLVLWRTDSPDDRSYVAAAGAMAMTWGDSMASIVGRRWGRHHYTIAGSRRSWEGSAAMLLAAGVSMFLTLMLVPGSALSPYTLSLDAGVAIAAAVSGALAATMVEGISPAGTDNLSVPLLAGAVVLAVTSLL